MDDGRAAPFSHCPHCGHRFPPHAGWPRRCASCSSVSYRNPVPVVVLAVPVEDLGVLMIRRVDPPVGLALPSGYVEHGERWQDAAARELAEETAIRVDASTIRELRVRSGDDGTLLVFATAPPIARAELAAFTPSPEASELVVVDGPRPDVVFPLDAEVVAALRSDERRPGPSPPRAQPAPSTTATASPTRTRPGRTTAAATPMASGSVLGTSPR